ncbi:MAG: hypothetical protein NTY03_00310 [Candidatus Bathyarchaeota archaeon]|nr:hypothetical protein [Candidatus Bathyarchaeota archaeon]
MSLLLLALIVINMIIPSIYPVSATRIYYPVAKGLWNGNIWYFYTYDTLHSPSEWTFSPRDVVLSSIVTYYKLNGVITYVKPLFVLLDPWHNIVWVFFNPKDIPDTTLEKIWITGTLKNGDTFVASGPGPMWRKGGG